MKKFAQIFIVVCLVLFGSFQFYKKNVHAMQGDGLIKGFGAAVYYYANSGRYAFPDSKTFKTWFTDFSSVKRISDSELGAIPLKGVVTYRPGSRMIKINTDPKVYAVDMNGTLRWIASEEIAKKLYGNDWNTKIDDVPDSFFSNYKMGEPIINESQFNIPFILTNINSINKDKKIFETPETPISGCVSNTSPVFTNHITDISKVNYVVPPPTIGAGPSLKTHGYIGTDYARVPVYAPVDMVLNTGAHFESGPYWFGFEVSCEITLRFGHITEPIQKVKDVFPSTPAPSNDSRDQQVKNKIPFKAGDLIGYTTGTSAAGNWDMGVYNSAISNKYKGSTTWGDSWVYNTAVCPFDYFLPDLKSVYTSKFSSTEMAGNVRDGGSFCN